MSPDAFILSARAAHGGRRGLRPRSLDDHRARGSADRRAGRDAAGRGRPAYVFARARPRRCVHRAKRAREPADECVHDLDVARLRASGADVQPVVQPRCWDQHLVRFGFLVHSFEWMLARPHRDQHRGAPRSACRWCSPSGSRGRRRSCAAGTTSRCAPRSSRRCCRRRDAVERPGPAHQRRGRTVPRGVRP